MSEGAVSQTTGTTTAVPGPRVAGEDPAARAGLVRNVRVGRQGIYRGDRSLVAYELLFRADGGARTEDVAGERATSQVIASVFGTFGLSNISDGRPVFINVTRAFLTGVIPMPVEAERVVVEVTENVVVDQELMLGLGQLRQQGYRIAIDDYSGDVERGALLDLAEYVKIDVNGTQPMLLPGMVARVRESGATLVAANVHDAETLERCKQLGFELFQGPLLQKPVVLERRTLSPSQLVCVRLLNDLADPDAPVQRIEQMVGSDPGLTLRLLRTANSAALGLTREVTSLRQGLVLIGPKRLRSWVMLTLLEGGGSVSSSDDLWAVLARAFACQKLGEPQGDLAFTVGLLSGAAELLGADVASVAEGAGLGAEPRAALLEGAGAAGKALTAVLAHERDEPEAVEATGLSAFEVSRTYLEALTESLEIVHSLVPTIPE